MSEQIPLVTFAVPSFNQGAYLDKALSSIFEQDIPCEVFVLDGGSTDNSLTIIEKWSDRLTGWRSHKDAGQSAAINEGIAAGTAPFVAWLNSDDWLLQGGLSLLIETLQTSDTVPVVYGKGYDFIQKNQKLKRLWVEPFDVSRLALRCIISQPATLIRRSAWQAVGGLNENLRMAMDYDLWWRLYNRFGSFEFINQDIAVNRVHALTKTTNYRRLHYQEAMAVVKREYGSVPAKWWLMQPYAVWLKTLFAFLQRSET